MNSCCRSYSEILFALILVIGSLFAGIHTAGAGVNPVSLPNATCPNNLNSCTANDVTTTVKDVDILPSCQGGTNDDTPCTPGGSECTGGGTCKMVCDSLNDKIRLRITNAYASTANQRYDLGLFVSKDGGSVQEPSTANLCAGAAAQAGQGNDGAYPDADTDLFLSLDPSGHANTPSTTDTCGDLDATAGPVDWTVDVTVTCNIVNNQLIIPSCRVWEQNANHKVSCQTLQQAGTGSKCDCTPLTVTADVNPCATTVCNDNNVCTNDSCIVVGTPGNLSAQCVYTPGNAGTVCREAGGVCDVADTCDGTTAVCADKKKPATTECRASAGICDVAESCDGSTNDCPADGFKAATTECRASAGICDVAESCTGTSALCPNDAFKPSTTECRASAGICDVAESCTGTGAACPEDGLKPATTVCRPAVNDCDVAESCTGTSVDCPPDATGCDFNAPTIEPTGTTCQQFRDGTSTPLGSVLYTLTKGNPALQTINSVSPGVFFVYDTLHMAATGDITVTESDGLLWTRVMPVNGSQVILYDLSCNLVHNYSNNPAGLIFSDGFLPATLTILGVPAGDYIMSVKYDPTALVGYHPPTVSQTYNFAVTAGGFGSGSASVLVDKKPK